MKFGMRVGSPQIIQCRTAGNRREAAAAKFAKSRGRVGAKFEARPPFAHLGAPMSMTRTRMPFARASRIVASRSAGQRYAGSAGFVGCAGFVRAISAQLIDV